MGHTDRSPGWDLTPVLAALHALPRVAPRPVVVGISGFGGAGKSTVAAALAALLPDVVVVPADEFLLARPPTTRSNDWSDVDRERLDGQVLAPARRGEAVLYQEWDSAAGAPGPWVEVGRPAVLVVEGIGLFVPDLADRFDLRVWLDVDLADAAAQGLWRDTHVYGNPQEHLWREVWVPNDAAFMAAFRPDLSADLRLTPPVQG